MFNPYSQELLDGEKKIDMSKVGNDIWKMMNHEKRGNFMYESPITYTIKEIYDNQMVERENFILTTVSEKIGVEVNREELIKALNYDRNQYAKGYADAKAEYTTKWTNVEEELPDLHEDSKFIYRKRSDEVMCIIKADEDLINSCGYLVEDIDGHKEWHTDCYMTDGDKVIAWMPIPKYKAESEE